MCSFIVLMPSVRIYNINSHENEGKTLNEKVCLNVWPVLYVTLLNPTADQKSWINTISLMADSDFIYIAGLLKPGIHCAIFSIAVRSCCIDCTNASHGWKRRSCSYTVQSHILKRPGCWDCTARRTRSVGLSGVIQRVRGLGKCRYPVETNNNQ